MPAIENGGVRIHYVLSGAEGGELLILSNSLGSNLSMWDKVRGHLEADYRVLRYDTRGQGESSAPPGAYTLDQLGNDVLILLDQIGVEQAIFCGLSLGGLTGMWLGLHAPQRLKGLVLANTAARIGSPAMWEDRIALVRQSGMKGLAAASLERWFKNSYRESHPAEMKQIRRMIESIDPEGYCRCCAVLRDADLKNSIGSIQTPTLVIAGAHDPATPPTDGRAIATKVPGAEYIELDASHLSAWERSGEFADAVVEFLAQGVKSNG